MAATISQRPLALVTGATAGIGAEFARQLAAKNHDLILVARNEARLAAMASELSQRHGISAEVLVADLANPEQIARVERRIAEVRALEVLVNNAGFGFGEAFLEVPPEEHDAMIRVHCIAPTRLARAALPAMTAAGRGAIINVSSVASFSPNAGRVTYGATKAYLNYLSESLQLEVAGSGVHVQALCPGFTRTEFHERAKVSVPAPNWLWLSPEKVVSESLARMHGATVIVIPGASYKVMSALMRTIPQSFVASLARRIAHYRKRA